MVDAIWTNIHILFVNFGQTGNILKSAGVVPSWIFEPIFIELKVGLQINRVLVYSLLIMYDVMGILTGGQ